MSKKMKMLMIALGVSTILVVSFAGIAMAAGPAGFGDRPQDCVQQGDRFQLCDPINDQPQDCIQKRDQLQDCDPSKDQIQDRVQQKDRLQDCLR
jgi:hypothetical protein